MPALPQSPDAREVVLRELISTFEQRTSGTTVDLFETAKRDLSGTKRLVYGGGTAFAALFSTIVGWSMDFVEQAQKQAETIETQSRNIEDLQIQLQLMSAKQNILGRRIVGNEILIVDGTQWLADKIDARRYSAQKKAPRTFTTAKKRLDDLGSSRLFSLNGPPGR